MVVFEFCAAAPSSPPPPHFRPSFVSRLDLSTVVVWFGVDIALVVLSKTIESTSSTVSRYVLVLVWSIWLV